jgi:two-component system OmpR family response regulator
MNCGDEAMVSPQLILTLWVMNAAMQPQPGPHLLVVDDDAGLLEQISGYLADQGFRVSSARDAVEMDRILGEEDIDLVVLDLMLPGEDGLSICQRLKRDGNPSILMLSAIGEDIDRIIGLELGADDYLAKPCVPRELVARVKAILRQKNKVSAPAKGASLAYSFCGFRLDILSRELEAPGGITVLLTAGEFSLLRAFVERPGEILSRDQLLDAARGENTDVFDRAIDVQLSRLRRKLADFTDKDLIKTYRGAGYLFSEAVKRL